MSSAPSLSIVTISFNQCHHLRQCVESVLSQKTSDVEYIVVDPGSTDGSREILAEYASAIDHLVLEPDAGPADGLNKGFARARGRYGYFINSDDFLLPGALDRLAALWRRHGETADALLCGAWIVDGEGRPLREARSMPVDLESLVGGRSTMVQHGFSFRTDLLRAVGGFNRVNRTCWDYEFLCALARHGARFHVCSERIGAFRLYSGSLSGGASGRSHLDRYHADLDRIFAAYMGTPPGGLTRVEQRIGRLVKHLRHPAIAAGLVLDRLSPSRRDRRWRADTGDEASGGPVV